MRHQPLHRRFSHRLTSFSLGTFSLLTTGLGVVTLPSVVSPAPAFGPTFPGRPTPDPDRKILTVSGQGRESIPTNLAQVTLGIEAKGKTAQEVQQDIARRSSAVITLLRSRGAEKLETTGVNLNPIYNTDDNRQKLVGYSGSNTINFRLPTEKMGSLLDDAVSAGASNVSGLSFIASDEAIATARQRALRAATQDAYAQAKTVLSALNLQPGEIAGITINNVTAPPPRTLGNFVGQDRLVTTLRASTELVGGEQEIVANVSLRIGY